MSKNLFEVVEGQENDVVAPPHQAHCCQQLQNQRFGPENTEVQLGLFYFGNCVRCQSRGFVRVSPRVPVVQAECDLVHTAGVFHHEVEASLKTHRGFESRPGREVADCEIYVSAFSI